MREGGEEERGGRGRRIDSRMDEAERGGGEEIERKR